jgi:heme-degrading monooxygenase HmoA
MHFEEALVGNTLLTEENLKSERYIASNRFKVKSNAGPKFEKRWADRKSRLASLPGFRFFTLLRKVNLDGSTEEESSFGNYVSLTVWEDKESFDAWRTGEAFKEAHGGGGITDFIKLLTTAIFILDGAPKPAFFDALSPIVNENTYITGDVEGGWRKVVADGQNFIPSDVFSSQFKYNVPEDKMVVFEKAWRTFEKENLKAIPGFVSFYLMRRDASKADDGYNYVALLFWKDKESYLNLHNSDEFGQMKDGFLGSRPVTHYYEGKLTLVSSKGG